MKSKRVMTKSFLSKIESQTGTQRGSLSLEKHIFIHICQSVNPLWILCDKAALRVQQTHTVSDCKWNDVVIFNPKNNKEKHEHTYFQTHMSIFIIHTYTYIQHI